MMNQIEEEWRDIAGYDGKYQVSNLGRVKSTNYRCAGKEQTLKLLYRNGYLRVALYKNGKNNRLTVHRLVAEAFIPNQNNLPQVNHKDENKLNNRVDNLEWCTAKYNNNYGTRTERVSVKLINNKKRSKPVLCVETGVIYPSFAEAFRKTGVYLANIHKCCQGKLKTTGGYHWRYANH